MVFGYLTYKVQKESIMTKLKLHETVLEICATHKASAKLVAALSDLTKPKAGGSSDVNDYTVFAEDGKTVEYIFCTVHKKWEPIVAVDAEDKEFDLFKTSDKTKNGFERECIDGAKAWKTAAKARKTSKDGIMQDLLEEEISGTEAKELIAKLETTSIVDSVPARADGLGEDDKPSGTEAAAE